MVWSKCVIGECRREMGHTHRGTELLVFDSCIDGIDLWLCLNVAKSLTLRFSDPSFWSFFLCMMHYSTSSVSVCLHMQVFQQALHRQPNTAAQYLQQMYAAQQQHLMLQTAALQQQHSLSTAQLQSLAAVQQVSKRSSRKRIILTAYRWCCYCWPPEISLSWLSFLPCDRPVLQLAGKARHRTALHPSKLDLLRLR